MKASLLIALVCLLIGCSKKDPEATCTTFYVSEEASGTLSPTKFYYNSDGQIASLQNQGANTRYDFTYKSKVLMKVASSSAAYLFSYANGRMVATVRTDNGAKADSIEYLYDGAAHIVRRNFYHPVGKTGVLYKYVLYEYTGNNPTKVEFYQPNGAPTFTLTSTFTYTYDTHLKPYPAEYELFDIAISNTNSENNITSLQITSTIGQSTPKSDMPVTYNSAGFPTHAEGYDYKYSCSPVVQ